MGTKPQDRCWRLVRDIRAMPEPRKPNPDEMPNPLPPPIPGREPMPIDEPEPERLPDEEPNPNPDETENPPLQRMASPPLPVPTDPQPPMPPGPRPDPGPDPSPVPTRRHLSRLPELLSVKKAAWTAPFEIMDLWLSTESDTVSAARCWAGTCCLKHGSSGSGRSTTEHVRCRHEAGWQLPRRSPLLVRKPPTGTKSHRSVADNPGGDGVGRYSLSNDLPGTSGASCIGSSGNRNGPWEWLPG